MQATMTESLPKFAESSDSFRIWKEADGGIDSKLTAVFIHALQTYWRDYLPKARPRFPDGFERDHDAYLTLDEVPKKSEAWKLIQSKYSGYFKARYESIADDLSNLNFLKEAKAHFEKTGMIGNALKVGSMISKFEGLTL